jgi:hypothetical protein
MVKLLRSAVLCLAFVFGSVALHAETLTHEEAGLEFTVPDDWGKEQEGDFLLIKTKGEDVVMCFMVGKEAEAAEFLKALGTELDKIMSDVKLDSKEPKHEEANGLHFSYVEGTGKIKNNEKFIPKGKKAEEAVQWDMTMVTGGKKLLAIVSFGKLDDNEAALKKVWDSIKKK